MVGKLSLGWKSDPRPRGKCETCQKAGNVEPAEIQSFNSGVMLVPTWSRQFCFKRGSPYQLVFIWLRTRWGGAVSLLCHESGRSLRLLRHSLLSSLLLLLSSFRVSRRLQKFLQNNDKIKKWKRMLKYNLTWISASSMVFSDLINASSKGKP